MRYDNGSYNIYIYVSSASYAYTFYVGIIIYPFIFQKRLNRFIRRKNVNYNFSYFFRNKKK